MVAAVVIACSVMYCRQGRLQFVANHPTTKMLALAFLVLIGVALGGRITPHPARHIYFAIVFAAAVELFNARQAQPPEGCQIAGLNRRVDKAAAMAFVSHPSWAPE
jgi:predicted tellurium resistance membrane protein TerC